MGKKTLGSLTLAFAKAGKLLEQNVGMALRMSGAEAERAARATTRFRDRSGVLRNSIAFDGPHGTLAGGDLHGVLSAGAPYASYIEKGTRPHLIKPTHRQALRWPVEGGFLFAKVVRHPGTAPRPFLAEAVAATEPRLRDELIPKAVELSFIQAGFDP